MTKGRIFAGILSLLLCAFIAPPARAAQTGTGQEVIPNPVTFQSSATITSSGASNTGLLISSGLVVNNGVIGLGVNSGNVGVGTLTPAEKLEVVGGIKVGYSNNTNAGTIRLNGTAFEGYTGAAWSTMSGSYTLDYTTTTWAQGPNSTIYSVTTSSNVAIGLTDSGGTNKLRIRGNTMDSSQNAIYADNAVGTMLMVVRNDGNVGIGSASPAYKLDVAGTVNATSFTGSGAALTNLTPANLSGAVPVGNGGTGAVTLTGVLKGNGTGAVSAMTGVGNKAARWFDANTLAASTLITDNGTNIGISAVSPDQKLTVGGNISQTGLLISSGAGNNYFAGNVGIGTSTPVGAFQVYDGSFTVTTDGKVGIGTKYPSADLHISKTAGVAGIYLTGESIANYPMGQITFGYNAMIEAGYASAFDQTYLGFHTKDTGSSMAERMRISKTGAVGIGTTVPEAVLHVLSGSLNESYLFIASHTTGGYGLVVTTSSKVAIGTKSPAATLDVRADSPAIMAQATLPAGSAYFQADSGNTGAAGLMLLNAGSKKWSIMNNSAGTNLFSVYDYTSFAHRLVIDSTGAVGIGTASPAARLDVVSTGTLADQYAQIWRDSTSLIVSSVSATGVMAANKFVGKMGTGAGQATMIGLAGTNLTTKGTTSVAEEVLLSYTLPANSLSANGKGVRITAWGTTAATSNTKTIRIRFGGLTGAILVFNDVMTTPNNLKWKYETVLFRTGPSAQKAIGTAMVGNQVQSVSVVTTAQTESAPIDIALTGYTPTTPGDITAEGLMVEFIN